MSDNYITKEEMLSFVEEMEKRTHGDDLITKTVLVTTKCVKDFVMHMPPEDVQPVVRCKDCKWYGRVDKRRFYRGMDCLQKHIDTIVPDRDFCSYAERRTE